MKEHVTLANAIFAEGITATEEQIANIINRIKRAESKQAKQIDTSIEGLTLTLGDDGLWLNFDTGTHYASINLSLQVSNPQSSTDRTILQWCRDTVGRYPEVKP
uniref:Uncharacterized protein n=1 Tax=viral metagenome TaxID=1070528 RepID=A0A6H1Z7C1_9ZZZZ